MFDRRDDKLDQDTPRLYRIFLQQFGLGADVCERCARSRLPAPFNLESYTYTATGGPTWTWDVGFARALVQSRRPTALPVTLDGVEVKLWLEHHAQIDEAHVQHVPDARLEEPVLLAPAPDGGGQVLVDGSHRAAALIRAGRDVTGYMLAEAESEMAVAIVPLTMRTVYRALLKTRVLPRARQ